MSESIPRSRGCIQVYTGNGKGKTTAALGLAVRARAAGKRVAIVYFDKGGAHYSERALLQHIGIDWYATGLDRIDPTTGRFRFGVLPEDTAEATRGIERAKQWCCPDAGDAPYDLVILDEVNTTVALGMIPESVVESLLHEKADDLEIVCTGRTEVARGVDPAPGKPWPNGNERQRWLSYFDRADLLTDMRLEKHYFYQGTPAREGMDY
ncbi:cob(I)yrinic acid a,c-diamide adenosyltransferase [Candidatus Uhrbacteria bacterium]|nr:cob(I)yrinic acid a,c-diamide adenosyltransferase [Candidatus Uhrbacteria bacterium]